VTSEQKTATPTCSERDTTTTGRTDAETAVDRALYEQHIVVLKLYRRGHAPPRGSGSSLASGATTTATGTTQLVFINVTRNETKRIDANGLLM
jgi:hypothetical protein